MNLINHLVSLVSIYYSEVHLPPIILGPNLKVHPRRSQLVVPIFMTQYRSPFTQNLSFSFQNHKKKD